MKESIDIDALASADCISVGGLINGLVFVSRGGMDANFLSAGEWIELIAKRWPDGVGAWREMHA